MKYNVLVAFCPFVYPLFLSRPSAKTTGPILTNDSYYAVSGKGVPFGGLLGVANDVGAKTLQIPMFWT